MATDVQETYSAFGVAWRRTTIEFWHTPVLNLAVSSFIQPGSLKLPIVIFEKNDRSVKLSDNSCCTNRTKHIDGRFHFIREKVEDGTGGIFHVELKKQPVDGLMRNLPEEIFSQHRKTLLNLSR